MTEMYEIGAVLIAVVVFLAFVAYADKQNDKDDDERKK